MKEKGHEIFECKIKKIKNVAGNFNPELFQHCVKDYFERKSKKEQEEQEEEDENSEEMENSGFSTGRIFAKGGGYAASAAVMAVTIVLIGLIYMLAGNLSSVLI